jgi:hypothetical protein
VHFCYYIIHRDDRLQEPRGMFLFNREDGRFDTITWDHLDRAWQHNPGAMRYLMGDADSTSLVEEVSRDHAEQIAAQLGFAPVPTEEELIRISDEAEAERKLRMGEQPER